MTLIAILLLFLLFPIPLAAQSKEKVVALPFSRAPYAAGERLTYNVSFANFPTAAHVELFVAGPGRFSNREGLQLRAHIETTGVINAALYSINNDYTSFIDPGTGLPFRAQEVRREGGRTADTSSEYNLPVGTTAIPSKLRTDELSGTYDFLSALYRLRALPLTEGARYYFTIRSEAGQYQVEVKVSGRELVKTNVGSFNAIITQVRVPNNSTANNYRVRIYFSDDERHVPVLITARHEAGEIRAELASSELPERVPAPAPANVAAVPPATQPTPGQVVPVPLVPRPTTGNPNTTTSVNPSLPAGLPFSSGEQLNFNVFLGGSTQVAGTASFQVRARGRYFTRDGLLLNARAQTVGPTQRVFFANDEINSYVDPTTLLPFRTEMRLQEGTRRINQTYTVDQDRGSILTDKGTRIDIPVGTHDMVSVFYALRSFNLTPPKRNAVSILVHNRPRTLFITAQRRETIELGGQKIPAVQLTLTTDDTPSDKYALRLWVSEDRRRLPLRVTATTPLGPIRADLAIIPVTSQ